MTDLAFVDQHSTQCMPRQREPEDEDPADWIKPASPKLIFWSIKDAVERLMQQPGKGQHSLRQHGPLCQVKSWKAAGISCQSDSLQYQEMVADKATLVNENADVALFT